MSTNAEGRCQCVISSLIATICRDRIAASARMDTMATERTAKVCCAVAGS